MKIDFIRDQTLDAAGEYMSRLSQRQQIVASNIANIDTPGFRTKDVSFHATMQELLTENSVELRTSRPGHAPSMASMTPPVQVFEVEGLPSRVDKNNVDIDKEMLKLSETSFGYSLMSQIVKGKLRTIGMSINEGRA